MEDIRNRAFETGVDCDDLTFCPKDVTNQQHLSRHRRLRYRPGHNRDEQDHRCNRNRNRTIISHGSVPKNKIIISHDSVSKNKKDDQRSASDVLLCLRLRLREKQQQRKRKPRRQQQSQKGTISYQGQDLKEEEVEEEEEQQYCTTQCNTNDEKDRIKAVTENESENEEADGPSMPAPTQEMTDLVHLQRNGRLNGRRFLVLGGVTGGLAAIREEQNNEDGVETPTEPNYQRSIANTKLSNNRTMVAGIAGNQNHGIPIAPMWTTGSNGVTTSPYNPNGYHFTNLPDGTPVYTSMSPFCFGSIRNDEDNLSDTAVRNHSKEEEEKGIPSLAQSNSESPSQRSLPTIGDNQLGVLYVGKSSIGPLAQSSSIISTSSIGPLTQSSSIISTREASEDKLIINNSIDDQFYDSGGSVEDVHQSEKNIGMTDREIDVDDSGFASFSSIASSLSSDNFGVADDSRFASSSIVSAQSSDSDGVGSESGFTSSSSVSALSASISSIAISTDTNPENDNAHVYKVDTLQHKKKRKKENNPSPSQKKRCDDNGLLVEGSVAEDDRRELANLNASTTQFKDIIGHQSVKLRLDEVLLPLALPASLSRTILKGVRSLPASILMYGPPGCGKTQLAKAVAGEAHAAFLSIGPSDILSKYVGESEEAVRSVFAEAVRLARKNRGGNRCTVLFFDEIDALGQSRGASSNGNGAMGGEGKAGLSPEGSEQSGAGDNSSRRLLAELLIQLTKINTVHGTYDDSSSSITESEEDLDEEEKGIEGSRLDLREDESKCGKCISSSGTVVSQDEMILEEGSAAKRQRDEIQRNFSDNDNCSVRVIVVAATNRPEDCDPALIRRFAVQVKVGLPTAKDRRKMLKRSMEDIDHTITKKQFSDLSLITEGWSGSDLQNLAREAAMAPVRECIRRAAQLKRRGFLSHSHREKKKIGDDIMAQINCGEETNSGSKSESEGSNVHDNSYTGPQKQLLKEFRNLRPVIFRDYKKALAFSFSRMYGNLYDSPLAKFGWIEDSGGDHDTNGNSTLDEHYDSSSDEDDEEEVLSIEGDQIECGINQENHRICQHWDTVV